MNRPIADTNERYVINEEGIVLDTKPFYQEHMDWQWETIDPTKPREVTITDERFCYTKDNGKQVIKNVHSILSETFPELYQISDENKQRIINSFENESQKTYTININDFNKLIYPNKLICLYDKTFNTERHIDPYDRRRRLWKRPTIIRPNENGMVVLRKGRKYFGLGTRNLINFNEKGLPINAKPWAEPINAKYY